MVRTRLMLAICSLLLIVKGGASAAASGALDQGFRTPPLAARPWVYWFWLNGNVNREGIRADLEAMQKVGIGGVLIMEVDAGAPTGPVAFAGPKWRELFKFAVSEARRLGVQVTMNNDAGWAGSGGPWITPDKAMQKLVWTETRVEGPRRFESVLKQPETVAGYYRDIAAFAFPTVGGYRIDDIVGKAAFERRDVGNRATYPTAPPAMAIPRAAIRELTATMGRDGRIAWDVPAGDWTIVRMGYTPTGVTNEPSPQSGIGLECDKLSREGAEAAFDGLIAKLTSDVGPLAGKTLVRTHIDSWEVHSQNWTARFPEEFRRRRGYDVLAYLPVVTGRVVESPEVSERFLWDFRQTIGEMLADNYAGHMAELAHRHGLGLSIEGYGDGTFDDMTYAGRADEPMSEFWSWPSTFERCIVQEMASTAHVYGKHIVGAESFTANEGERWLHHPASLKALGDWAYCRGVNRFVIHRYAMQPWPNIKPGMSMGACGLHYERTQTWWSYSPPWNRYMARCQYMLRQGLPVGDILYVGTECCPNLIQLSGFALRSGYDADGCPAEVVVRRLKVRGGRLVLPDGMSYRALVLPPSATMTLEFLRRVKALADAGALIVGSLPTAAPGLSGYPGCDQEIRSLASALQTSGKVITGKTAEKVLAEKGVPRDFSSDRPLDFNHRRAGDTDIYFVSNGGAQDVNATCEFRVSGKQPELWNPETGAVENIPMFVDTGRVTRLMLHLEPSGSAFIVFRSTPSATDSVVRLSCAGHALWPAPAAIPHVEILRALWGPEGDAKRTKDVTAQVKAIVATGYRSFLVSDLAAQGDPAPGVLKKLSVEYLSDGQSLTATGCDPDFLTFTCPSDPPLPVRLASAPRSRLTAEVFQPGAYELRTRSGGRAQFRVPSVPRALMIGGPWRLSFAPGGGAPGRISLDRLISWSDCGEPGVKYFSGTATYRRTFTVPAGLLRSDRRIHLDLGRVEVIAQPTLNGKALPILWKPPFVIDVTDVLRPGTNALEIRVVNLWPNRMIGDEQLPEDSPRTGGATVEKWPTWLQEGKPSPTGRFTFTSWRLWKKDEKLLPSGLLGPVRLRASVRVRIGDLRAVN